MTFDGYERISQPNLNDRNAYQEYTCGYCGNKVSGIVVAKYNCIGGYSSVKWLICTCCGEGSVCTPGGRIFPSTSYGPIIEGLPELIQDAYQEARDCFSVEAFSACELLCRKILMHIAVEKGAKEKESFTSYITFLSDKGYVTPPMKEWVELIREHGGKATHLIEKPDRKRAESTFMFTAELLRLIYEMEHIGKKYMPKSK